MLILVVIGQMMAGHMDGGQGMVVHEQIVVGDMSGHGQVMGDHTMGETVVIEMPMGTHTVDGQVVQGQMIEGQMVAMEGHGMVMGEMVGHTGQVIDGQMIEMPMGTHVVDGQVIQGQMMEGQMVGMSEMVGHNGQVINGQMIEMPMGAHIVDGQVVQGQIMEGQMVVMEGQEMVMGEMIGHTSKREAEIDYEGYDY